MTVLVAIVVGGLPAASAQDDARDPYSAIIDQYRSDPERAIEQATALSPAAFTASPGGGIANALDASGSMDGWPLGHLKDGARAALDALRADDRAALIAFIHVITPPTPWTSERQQLTAAIAGLEVSVPHDSCSERPRPSRSSRRP